MGHHRHPHPHPQVETTAIRKCDGRPPTSRRSDGRTSRPRESVALTRRYTSNMSRVSSAVSSAASSSIQHVEMGSSAEKQNEIIDRSGTRRGHRKGGVRCHSRRLQRTRRARGRGYPAPMHQSHRSYVRLAPRSLEINSVIGVHYCSSFTYRLGSHNVELQLPDDSLFTYFDTVDGKHILKSMLAST